MPAKYSYSPAELATAVAGSHSWRGVLRALGRNPSSRGALRTVRRHVETFGVDYSHFTGQRRWSDAQLADAVATSNSWLEVLAQIGLAEGGGSLSAIRAHAARLGLDASHLRRSRSPSESPLNAEPQLSLLRVAGPTLAAAWFMLRGHEVLWPLEPCRYDLAVRTSDSYQRVQVKTATYRSAGSYVAHLSSARRNGRIVYDPDEIDCFFVIDAELNAYLIPFADVGGRKAISLRRYREYLVAEAGQWQRSPEVHRTAS